MMKKILLLVIIVLMLGSVTSINASITTDCGGSTISTANVKSAYLRGEQIEGSVVISNGFGKDVNAVYTARLSQGSKIFYEETKINIIPAGTSVFRFASLFGPLAVPTSVNLGKAKFELNGQIEQCLWQNAYLLDVVSCFDGIRNGDEEGIDCGGVCLRPCPIPITTSTVSTTTTSTIFVEEVEEQIIVEKSIFVRFYEWFIDLFRRII